MRKYRILYITNYGSFHGGGEISLLELVANLDRNRFTPFIISPEQGDLVEEFKKSGVGVKIIKFPSPKSLNLWRVLFSIYNLARFIKKEKIDLIHSNAINTALHACLAGFFTSTPLVWHVRVRERDLLLDRFKSIFCKRVIVNSESVRRRFYWISKDRVKVVYNGVDIERYGAGAKGYNLRQNWGISEKEFLVGVISQLIPRKGHKCFFQSVVEVINSCPEAKFLIVGDEPKPTGYKGELINLADKLGLKDRTIFTGFRRDIPEILNVLDLLVLPSEQEGFGRVLIEAMAVSKPVVSTDSGGTREIVADGKTGILIPVGDSSAMGKAIVKLIRDRKTAVNMGIAGRERAMALFDLKKQVAKIQQIYQECL